MSVLLVTCLLEKELLRNRKITHKFYSTKSFLSFFKGENSYNVHIVDDLFCF